MNTAEKKKLKKKISEELAVTEESIQRMKNQEIPVSLDSTIGRLTRMDAIGSKKMKEANLRQAEKRLSGLKSAIVRIDDGEFGYCSVCGEEIPMKRLLAVPESPCCVNCA